MGVRGCRTSSITQALIFTSLPLQKEANSGSACCSHPWESSQDPSTAPLALPKCFGPHQHLQSGGKLQLEDPCCRIRVGNLSPHAGTYSAVFSGIRNSTMSQPGGNTPNENRQVI